MNAVRLGVRQSLYRFAVRHESNFRFSFPRNFIIIAHANVGCFFRRHIEKFRTVIEIRHRRELRARADYDFLRADILTIRGRDAHRKVMANKAIYPEPRRADCARTIFVVSCAERVAVHDDVIQEVEFQNLVCIHADIVGSGVVAVRSGIVVHAQIKVDDVRRTAKLHLRDGGIKIPFGYVFHPVAIRVLYKGNFLRYDVHFSCAVHQGVIGRDLATRQNGNLRCRRTFGGVECNYTLVAPNVEQYFTGRRTERHVVNKHVGIEVRTRQKILNFNAAAIPVINAVGIVVRSKLDEGKAVTIGRRFNESGFNRRFLFHKGFRPRAVRLLIEGHVFFNFVHDVHSTRIHATQSRKRARRESCTSRESDALHFFFGNVNLEGIISHPLRPEIEQAVIAYFTRFAVYQNTFRELIIQRIAGFNFQLSAIPKIVVTHQRNTEVAILAIVPLHVFYAFYFRFRRRFNTMGTGRRLGHEFGARAIHGCAHIPLQIRITGDKRVFHDGNRHTTANSRRRSRRHIFFTHRQVDCNRIIRFTCIQLIVVVVASKTAPFCQSFIPEFDVVEKIQPLQKVRHIAGTIRLRLGIGFRAFIRIRPIRFTKRKTNFEVSVTVPTADAPKHCNVFGRVGRCRLHHRYSLRLRGRKHNAKTTRQARQRAQQNCRYCFLHFCHTISPLLHLSFISSFCRIASAYFL